MTSQREPLLAAIRAAALSLKAAAAADRFHTAMGRLGTLLRQVRLERRYNPNWPSQPRVPAGHPDGGQWTDGGAAGEALEPSALEETVAGEPEGEPPPEVPRERPDAARPRNRLAKEVAHWLYRGVRVGVRVSPLGRLLVVYEAGLWIYEHWPYIEAYQDGPKTLDELRAAALEPRKGYDIHHIVERTPALEANLPRERVDGPENLVRIPTLKHWELNAWYETRNPDYGWLTPRQYLLGKNWDERFRVGIGGLTEVGVFRP